MSINLDEILKLEPPVIGGLFEDLMDEVGRRYKLSREKALVITKIEEAALWLSRAELEEGDG